MEEGLKYFIITLTSIILVFISIGVAFMLFYRNRKLRFVAENQQLAERMKTELLNIRTEVQEQTLHHVCQELHDNIGQKLSVVRIYINRLETVKTEQSDKTELKDISETLGDTIEELRGIVNTLNPDAVKKRKLVEALRLEQGRINQSKVVTCDIEVEGASTELNDDKEDLIIYRICQEFIQNSLKHSGCDKITILLNFSETDFELSIADNGKGFAFENPDMQLGGNGLTNMQNRAGIINAKLRFEHNVPNGFKLILSLPLQ